MKIIHNGVRDGVPYTEEVEVDDAEIAKRKAEAEARRAAKDAALAQNKPTPHPGVIVEA